MAAVTLSGFNGIDFNTILNAVMQAESRPLVDLQKQQLAVQDKDTALASLAGIIEKLRTPVAALTAPTAFSNLTASSTDMTVATVSLGDGGILGQYDMAVTQLAKSQVTSSTNGYSATTDTVATGGTISFTIGTDTTDPITITGATSLSELRDQINNQDSGVVASVVNDGTNYKLVITSRETGEDNGFTINNSLTNSSGPVVAFAVGQNPSSGNAQNAQNAQFSVNGLDIESGSNTVSEAVPGATITLVNSGETSINVSKDFTSLKNSIKSLVSEYNNLRQFYTQQVKGPLRNDAVMRQALNDLKTVLLTSNDNGGRYQYLSEIGLELTSTGNLKLDETKLNLAIDSYATDLEALFQGTDTVDGALDNLKESLDNLDGTAGMIKIARDSIDTILKSYRNRIDAQQLRLGVRREQLTKTYAAVDAAMSRLSAVTQSLQKLQNQSF